MPEPLLCSRCGDQLDEDETRELLDRIFCAPCFEKPGVNFLAEFKLKHWRKRDGFIWLFGGFGLFISSLVLLGIFTESLRRGFRLEQAVLLAFTLPHFALSGATLALWRPARLGWILYFGTLCGMGFVGNSVDESGKAIASLFPIAIVMLFPVSAYFSKQNQLAYGIDITEEQLIKLYRNIADNRWAQTGMLLGALSILPTCGFVGLLALPISIVGLLKVDEEAWPPVGLRGRAIAGIVCSLIGILLTLTILLLG